MTVSERVGPLHPPFKGMYPPSARLEGPTPSLKIQPRLARGHLSIPRGGAGIVTGVDVALFVGC
eukprot:8220417-Pyramimonas_sp.AAC.1